MEEQHISVGQLVKKGMEEKNMTAKGINLKEKIMKLQNIRVHRVRKKENGRNAFMCQSEPGHFHCPW